MVWRKPFTFLLVFVGGNSGDALRIFDGDQQLQMGYATNKKLRGAQFKLCAA